MAMANKTTSKKSAAVGLGRLEDVERVFSHLDADGDGRISPIELGTVVKALGSDTSTEQVQTMMEEMDANHDGFVDLKEFADFFYGSDRGGDDQELRDAFEMYDLDHNGVISAGELHLVLEKLGDKSSVRDCSRMIRSVDGNGDGCVSFEEFKKMMMAARPSPTATPSAAASR